MKERTKNQKGITLIALIITIVVLMILAAVAINSITNDGIIGKAESVRNTYTEAQNEEQKMLKYYELVLSGKAWTQNGTTVTRNGQTLEVGEKVNLKVGTADVEAYSAGDYEGNWVVLGAEYGKLLLVSASNVVSSVALGGAYGGNIHGTECVAGYYNGVEKLHEICSIYLNETYADKARSITVDDINRVTGYVPERGDKYNHDYGTTYTYTDAVLEEDVGCFYHIDGRRIDVYKHDVIIQETNTYYRYLFTDYITNETAPIAYEALFNNTDYDSNPYWLASSFVYAGPDYYAGWGLFLVMDEGIGYDDYLWYSGEGAWNITRYGARAVVSIKPEVQVVTVEA